MKSVLYLTKKTIYFLGDRGKTASVNWNGRDLTDALSVVKKNTKITQTSIVLGNDLSYTLGFSSDQDKDPTRESILNIAKKYIPENVDNHNFDWKKVGNFIQVIAVPPKLLNDLSYSAKKNDIDITHIETAATVLSKSILRRNKPYIISHKDQESLVVSGFQGVAFLAYSKDEISLDILTSIASAAKEQHGQDIQDFILSGKQVDKAISIPAQWKIVKTNINVMADAIKKKKVKKTSEDKEDLDIKPLDKPVEPDTSPEPDESKKEVEEPKETEETIEVEKAEEPETASEPEVNSSESEESKPAPVEDAEEVKELEKPESTKETEKIEESEITPEPDESKKEVEEPKETEETIDTTSIPAATPEITFDQDSEPKGDRQAKTKSTKGLFVSLAITLVVGGSLTGGILYSRSATTNQDIRSQASETQEVAPAATPTPTATPTPETLDLTDYSVQILNGSGTVGEAGVVNDLLQEEGFQKADMDNADSYDYTETEVQLKEGLSKEVYTAIKETLGDYQVTKGTALDTDSEYDVIVIVGTKD